MILLLGYLAGLFSTFVISTAMLSVMAQLSKHELNKHHGNSRVARATAEDKSTSVVADVGRAPEIAGKEVEKR
jgi:hypothetical protein